MSLVAAAMDGLVCMYCKRRFAIKDHDQYHRHVRLHRKRYYGRKSLYHRWFTSRGNKSSQHGKAPHPPQHGPVQNALPEGNSRALRRKKILPNHDEASASDEFKVFIYGNQQWYFLKANRPKSASVVQSRRGKTAPHLGGSYRTKKTLEQGHFANTSADDYIDLTFPDVSDAGGSNFKPPPGFLSASSVHPGGGDTARPKDWQHVRQWRMFWDQQLQLSRKRKPKKPKSTVIPVITLDDDDIDDNTAADGTSQMKQSFKGYEQLPSVSINSTKHEELNSSPHDIDDMQMQPMAPPPEKFVPLIDAIVYKCKYCGVVVESEDELCEHEGAHTGNMPYLCMICNARFALVTNFRAHEKDHLVDIAKHTGEILDLEKQSSSDHNTANLAFMTPPPPGKPGRKPRQDGAAYKCEHCGIEKRERRIMVEHIRTHTGEHPLKCKYCSMMFSHRGSRNKHERRHEKRAGTFDQSVQCNFCNITLPDRNALRKHVLDVHGQAKPFRCRYCGKCFAHKCNVEAHERVHTGDKPFKCPMCPAAFIQLSQKMTHVWTHTGEKPYKCRFCESTFRTSSVRKNHERVHTGEKPYHCTFCSAAFARRTNLKQHLISHTDVKPKQCQYCGKGLTSNRSLKRHEESHRRKELKEQEVAQNV